MQSASGTSSGSGTPPLSVLPTRLGLSVRAAEAVAAAAAAAATSANPAGSNSRSGPAGTSTPAPGASGFSLSTAPFQADPATFERVVLQVQRSGNASPAAATCDTASVRSLDTSSVSAANEIIDNEPQDLSMGGAMSSASSVSEMTAGDDPTPSTSKGQGQFTSPKKAFMMREAANREINREAGEGTSKSTTASSAAAPDVLVVPTQVTRIDTGVIISYPSSESKRLPS